MDKTKNLNDAYLDIEFLRSESLSKQNKIMGFWKYLDNQEILKPYEASFVGDEKPENIFSTISLSSSEAPSSSKSPTVKPKQKMKKNIKEKKSAGDSCKLERYLREDLKYADAVEVSYDEINAEIEDFQKRLLRCNCKNKMCECEKKIQVT